MDVKIQPLKRRDFDAARKFAIEGMHLTWYTQNKLELYLYSKYFWYLEISKASTALGAYMGDELVGVLLADMNHQPKVFKSIWYKAFIKVSEFVINLGYKEASNTYDEANIEMLDTFKKENKVDGELNFFAVNPVIKGKGIGSLLLSELEKQQKGKHIYLYTDSGSTYQFYMHRGFIQSGKKEIKMNLNNKEVPLTCFLFSKTL